MSKKGYLIGAIVVIVIILFVLFAGGNDTETPDVVVKSSTVTLTPSNNSGVSGTATITEVDGNAKVNLMLTGFTPDVAHPNHFHMGTCSSLGEVKYPLTASMNGSSETMLAVSFDQLMSELPLALNVHKSDAEMSVNVACGEVTAPVIEGDDANGEADAN